MQKSDCENCNLFVLVCGDGDKLGFTEDVGTKRAVGQVYDVGRTDDVEARLVLLH